MKNRLKQYREWAMLDPVPELSQLSAENVHQLQQLLKLTWEVEEPLRSFSPLAKGFLKPRQIIYANQGFIPQERQFIKQVANLLFDTYGDPIFKYSGYNEDCRIVRQFQSLQRFSPKITPGAHKRRFDALTKYFEPKKFSPDPVTWEKTITIVRDILNFPQVEVQFKPEYMRGLFAAHASNVGYPYYRNELSKKDGKTYRDITVDMSTQLIEKYNSATWVVACPATIIGRDQPGGNSLDLNKTYTKASLLKALDHIEYKPSKARPVWAVPRVVNNIASPFLKAIIQHPQFLSNPAFCGFLSREQRVPKLAAFERLANQLNMIPVNIDFSSFDTTISEELLLTALDLCMETVTPHQAPDDIIDAIKASAIFTHAIAYSPYTKRIVKKMKSNSIPSGHAYTGLAGFVCALLVMVYAQLVYYGQDHVNKVKDTAQSLGAALSYGLGDDYLGLINTMSDLKYLAEIINRDFGMIISTDSIKTSVGVDFLQEYYHKGSIEYPIARLAPSALYTERASGKGFAMWDMSFASMLYNIRTNPERTLIGMTSLFQSLDTTDLGLKNIDGNQISQQEFMQYLRRECAARDATPKQLLWDGDPAKESKFTSSGQITSQYLQWYFSLINYTIKQDGAFSTSALRTIWQEFK